jgi:hypothetical protein
MSIGKTGHVLVRTPHSRGQPKGQRFQSSKSAMSGGLKLDGEYDAMDATGDAGDADRRAQKAARQRCGSGTVPACFRWTIGALFGRSKREKSCGFCTVFRPMDGRRWRSLGEVTPANSSDTFAGDRPYRPRSKGNTWGDRRQKYPDDRTPDGRT